MKKKKEEKKKKKKKKEKRRRRRRRIRIILITIIIIRRRTQRRLDKQKEEEEKKQEKKEKVHVATWASYRMTWLSDDYQVRCGSSSLRRPFWRHYSMCERNGVVEVALQQPLDPNRTGADSAPPVYSQQRMATWKWRTGC